MAGGDLGYRACRCLRQLAARALGSRPSRPRPRV